MTARAPLIDGTVQIDGVEPVCMTLSPEEIFFRALRHAEFDICELSLSSFTVKTAQGDWPYVGVPAFVSRAFRHTSIYVRTDRIKKPEDLKGKTRRRAGISVDRQCVGARHSGRRLRRQAVRHPLDPRRHRGRRPAGEDHRSRCRRTCELDNAPEGKTISALLAEGAIDGFIAPRPPSLPKNTPQCRLAVSPIRWRPPRTISSAPAFSRSCIWSACGASWPSSIPGCRARCSRRSSRRRAWRSNS